MQCHTDLINPNIATVQTSHGMADRVYFQPVTFDVVKEARATRLASHTAAARLLRCCSAAAPPLPMPPRAC